MEQFVEQTKGVWNDSAFAIHINEAIGNGSILVQASFDGVGMDRFANIWGLAPGAFLELV